MKLVYSLAILLQLLTFTIANESDKVDLEENDQNVSTIETKEDSDGDSDSLTYLGNYRNVKYIKKYTKVKSKAFDLYDEKISYFYSDNQVTRAGWEFHFPSRNYSSRFKKLRKNPFFSEEMDKLAKDQNVDLTITQKSSDLAHLRDIELSLINRLETWSQRISVWVKKTKTTRISQLVTIRAEFSYYPMKGVDPEKVDEMFRSYTKIILEVIQIANDKKENEEDGEYDVIAEVKKRMTPDHVQYFEQLTLNSSSVQTETKEETTDTENKDVVEEVDSSVEVSAKKYTIQIWETVEEEPPLYPENIQNAEFEVRVQGQSIIVYEMVDEDRMLLCNIDILMQEELGEKKIGFAFYNTEYMEEKHGLVVMDVDQEEEQIGDFFDMVIVFRRFAMKMARWVKSPTQIMHYMLEYLDKVEKLHLMELDLGDVTLTKKEKKDKAIEEAVDEIEDEQEVISSKDSTKSHTSEANDEIVDGSGKIIPESSNKNSNIVEDKEETKSPIDVIEDNKEIDSKVQQDPTPKETDSKLVVDDPPKDVVDEPPKDVVNESQKDVVNESQKDVVEGTPKDVVEGTPKEVVDGTPKSQTINENLDEDNKPEKDIDEDEEDEEEDKTPDDMMLQASLKGQKILEFRRMANLIRLNVKLDPLSIEQNKILIFYDDQTWFKIAIQNFENQYLTIHLSNGYGQYDITVKAIMSPKELDDLAHHLLFYMSNKIYRKNVSGCLWILREIEKVFSIYPMEDTKKIHQYFSIKIELEQKEDNLRNGKTIVHNYDGHQLVEMFQAKQIKEKEDKVVDDPDKVDERSPEKTSERSPEKSVHNDPETSNKVDEDNKSPGQDGSESQDQPKFDPDALMEEDLEKYIAAKREYLETIVPDLAEAVFNPTMPHISPIFNLSSNTIKFSVFHKSSEHVLNFAVYMFEDESLPGVLLQISMIDDILEYYLPLGEKKEITSHLRTIAADADNFLKLFTEESTKPVDTLMLYTFDEVKEILIESLKGSELSLCTVIEDEADNKPYEEEPNQELSEMADPKEPQHIIEFADFESPFEGEGTLCPADKMNRVAVSLSQKMEDDGGNFSLKFIFPICKNRLGSELHFKSYYGYDHKPLLKSFIEENIETMKKGCSPEKAHIPWSPLFEDEDNEDKDDPDKEKDIDPEVNNEVQDVQEEIIDPVVENRRLEAKPEI